MLTEYLWRRLMTRLVRTGHVLQPLRTSGDDDYVTPIAIGQRYPGLGDCPIYMSAETPASERADTLSLLTIEVALRFKEYFGLTRRYQTPYTGTGSVYPREFSQLLPEPQFPDDFAPEADRLAGIASRGPFSILTRRERGGFVIDLRYIERLRPRAPFVRAGGIARFARMPSGALATQSVELDGQLVPYGQGSAWKLAEKRFLAGLNTHTTMIEHLLNLHFFGGGVWAICTFLALSPRHPLRRLLCPFMTENMRVNNDQIEGLLQSEASNIPSYSGYPLATVDAAIRQLARDFDVRVVDPEYRAQMQGQLDDPHFETVASLVALWRIFRRFALAWCEKFVKPQDVQARIWCEELEYRIPNGIKRLIELERWEDLSLVQIAHLAALGMFASSVGHHVVNDLVVPYFMQFHVMPSAVDADGHPTLGIVYEKRNSIFVAGIKRYLLIGAIDFPNSEMSELWREFQTDLTNYEAASQLDPSGHTYRVAPSQVARSIHA